MRHCVGSYANSVQSGDYLVYHIEGTTLGLSRCSGRWQIQQHYGKCNSRNSVTEGHKEVAKKVERVLNEM